MFLCPVTISGYLDVTADPISWCIGQISGSVTLSDGTTTVSTTARWIPSLASVPWVTVYHKAKVGEWITLGAGRRRWNTNLGVRLWAKTQADRDAMYRSLKKQVSSVAKSYSAAGFIWTEVTDARPLDEVDKVPPLYSTDVTVRVLYDETMVY